MKIIKVKTWYDGIIFGIEYDIKDEEQRWLLDDGDIFTIKQLEENGYKILPLLT